MKYVFLVSYLAVTVTCQKWLSEKNREVYTTEGDELTLRWQIGKQGKEVFFAIWRLVDENNIPQLNLVSVDVEGAITINNETKIECKEFGVITFLKVESQIDQRVMVEVEFIDGDGPLTDYLVIRYGGALAFQEELPPSVRYGEAEGRRANLSVTGEGIPAPRMFWSLDGQPITLVGGITVLREELPKRKQMSVIKETLTIEQVSFKHNGLLKVTMKYGDLEQQSPQLESTTDIRVEFAPREVHLTSNLSTHFVRNNYFVELTCQAKASPPPLYTIKLFDQVISSNTNGSIVTYIDPLAESSASFICFANNTIGANQSNVIDIIVFNSTDYGGHKGQKDENEWWIYYLVIISVCLVIFIGTAVTLLVIRRRMRSLNIRQYTSKIRQRTAAGQSEYERKVMRHNHPSHVYSLNQRGAPDGQHHARANLYSHEPASVAEHSHELSRDKQYETQSEFIGGFADDTTNVPVLFSETDSTELAQRFERDDGSTVDSNHAYANHTYEF